MALYLVQHGKSLAKDVDPGKGLTEEGFSETQDIARLADTFGLKVNRILHSGKKRARQTAEVLAEKLKPVEGMEEAAGLGPLDDVEQWARNIQAGEGLMMVGHLPFMEKLTSHLICGRNEPAVFKFQNSGIVCLERDVDTETWFIQWSLLPHIS